MNQVLIQTNDNSLRVILDQGPIPPKIVGGFPTWNVIDRPKKTSLTQYSGKPPWSMQINFMLDGLSDGISQEGKIKIVIWMTLPAEGMTEPRPLRLMGALPFPSGGLWIITAFDYGDNVIWADDLKNPHRVRQDMNITFTQYIKDDRIQFVQSTLGKPKTHTWRAGDSLRQLAAMYLGDASKWRKIADANNVRDPGSIQVGQKLVIP